MRDDGKAVCGTAEACGIASLLVATCHYPFGNTSISASLLDESCDCDVEDGTFSELVDNPGTTRDTKLSVLQIILFPSLGESWLLTADPLKGVSVVFAKLA